MTFRLIIQWMLLGGALVVALSAQSVKFTAVSLGDTLPDIEYENGGKPEKLTIPAFSRSELKKYSGKSLLDFYTTAEKDGKKQKIKFAEVALPEKTSQLLLVFSPQSDGTAKVQALDDTPETMPRGSARLYNATTMTIAIKYNADAIVLPPYQHKIMPAPPPQVVVQVAYQKQGNWVRGCSNVFATDSDIRQTIFVVASDSDIFKVQTPGGNVVLSPLQSFTLPELVKTEPTAP
jgi:hypothetical protein